MFSLSGKHDFEVLANTHSRDALIEHAKNNGVHWEEHSHPGVNWMRASGSLSRHLSNGKDFHTDNLDRDTTMSMIKNYHEIREAHKKTMIPHLRSAMAKIHNDKGDPNAHPMDYLDDAHAHLEANGGKVWSDKIHTLRHLNHQIQHLSHRLGHMPTE